MIRRAAVWLAPAATVMACPLAAAAERSVAVDLPAGPLGAAVDALAHQTGTSVVLADPALWRRRVPAVRGRMTPEAALRRLARLAGADLVPLGRAGWRLTLAPPRTRPAVSPPPAVPAAPPEAAPDVVVLASKLALPERRMAGSVEVIEAPRVGIEAGSAALVARSTLLSSTYRGPGREKLFIRGIADLGFLGRLQAVTGQSLGEVRLTYNAADPDLQLNDIASVEVLQGPQGTLYGTGAMGGMIRLNPNMPLRGETSVTVGGGVSRVAHGGTGGDVDAVLNLPLGDTLAVRAVGYARDEAGFIDKPAVGRDVNRTRIGGGRATVRWWPRDGWTVDGVAVAQTSRARDTQYATRDAPPLTSLTSIAEPFGADYGALHLVVTGALGETTLVSATGVATQRSRERTAPRLPIPGTHADLDRRHALATHETRLSHTDESGLSWVAGAAITATRSTVSLHYEGFDALDQSSRSQVSELALFGEASLPLTSFLTIGGGARAAQVRSTFLEGIPDVLVEFGTSPDRFPRGTLVQRWLLPSASVLVTPTKRLTLYGRYGVGRRAAGTATARDEAAAERLATIDLGVRWRPRDTLEAVASFQRGQWRALQFDVFESFNINSSGGQGDWSIDSLHGTLDWTPRPNLRLAVAVSINRQAPANAAARAQRYVFPEIADVIARAEVDWSRAIGRSTVLRASGWLRYEGPSGYADFGPQGDYLRSGLVLAAERRSTAVTLTVENLLDSARTRNQFPSVSVDNGATPLQPRTVRIGLRRHF